MSRPSTSAAQPPVIRPEEYGHSPVHYAVAIGDHAALSRLVSSLPRLADPSQILTESDSLAQERVADRISAALDRRDVPLRETPLHLAVRLNDAAAARTLAAAGADASLQNSAGWNALQEALCRRSSDVALVLLGLYHRAAWAKWRRRLPRLVAALRRMRDFYMEISFHFESSIVPFVGKIAPSDTYKIWKRDGNLRADTSLAGFDGLKIQRADQSFLFLGDGDREHGVQPGSLLVLNRDDRKIIDAFESAGAPMTESDIAGICSQTSVYRPGMDVTKAELVGRTNWRRQEKTETVGEWKARVYEVHNVIFSFRSRKVAAGNSISSSAVASSGSERVLPLDLQFEEDDDDEGFLVAENPNFGIVPDRRRHSSFVREERDFMPCGRRSVDFSRASAAASMEKRRQSSVSTAMEKPRPSFAATAAMEKSRPSFAAAAVMEKRRPPSAAPVAASQPPLPLPPATKEKEYVRSLRPSVWLTEQFPLKTEELLPLLDILASKVKAVRRMRELLTTKFPPGTFPVKVAIPVVPTVRVVITFTKFVELPSTEQFYTPLSSPRQLRPGWESPEDQRRGWRRAEEGGRRSSVSSSSSAAAAAAAGWLRRSSSGWKEEEEQLVDPFEIPSGYKWRSVEEKNPKMKRSKSTRKIK